MASDTLALPKVAILGSGPVAAYACAAAVAFGITPVIYGLRPKPLQRSGAFWLHYMPSEYFYGESDPHSKAERPIHNERLPSSVKVKYLGTREEYVSKQWGHYDKSWSCSFGNDASPHRSRYAETPALEWLCRGGDWRGPLYAEPLGPLAAHPEGDWERIQEEAINWDLFVVTAPVLPIAVLGKRQYNSLIALSQLTIASRPLWSLPPMSVADDQDFLNNDLALCVYNGRMADPWTRMTIMDGRLSVETTADLATHEDMRSFFQGPEVSVTTLNDIPPWVSPPDWRRLLPSHIMPAGRWATLDREELSHTVHSTLSYRLRSQFGLVPVRERRPEPVAATDDAAEAAERLAERSR